MKKKRVVDIVEELVVPFLEENNMELVDVEFVKEGPYRYLRVTIDKEEGISVDDTTFVSRFINEKLDTLDPIEEQYFLEVTSPGIERILKKDRDFEKFSGEIIEIKLYQTYEGLKLLKGELLGLENDHVIIINEKLGRVEIAKSKIAQSKIVVDFE